MRDVARIATVLKIGLVTADYLGKEVPTTASLAPVALPWNTYRAVTDVQQAFETKKPADIADAVAAGASVIGTALATTGLAASLSKTAARAVPGLSAGMVASDVVWATAVWNNPDASKMRKGLSLFAVAASFTATAASDVPGFGTAVALGASLLSTGAGLLSSFV